MKILISAYACEPGKGSEPGVGWRWVNGLAGRVELSTGGWLRGRDAGVDVMGDGTLVPYAGGLSKRKLDSDSPFDAVREELR